MRAITIHQPWAYWIAVGYKTIETRLNDRFKGLVGERIDIHAGQKHDSNAHRFAFQFLPKENGPFLERKNYQLLMPGAIICTAFVESAKWLNGGHSESALIECKYTQRFGLFLTDIQKIKKPIFYKGRQGIFHIEEVDNES